jgi:hypothetical protein|tara:strand:- start:6402 stop:6575 length:174 start_codon:yes stop_codon:yes gene_type:complete
MAEPLTDDQIAEAFHGGMTSAKNGRYLSDCRYPWGSERWKHWRAGYAHEQQMEAHNE